MDKLQLMYTLTWNKLVEHTQADVTGDFVLLSFS